MRNGFTDLEDIRLVYRGNKILSDLFGKGVHSIRQITGNESEAKAMYRFLQNERVGEDDIVSNLSANCQSAVNGNGRYVLCIQDTTEINLSSHVGRIKKDAYIGSTGTKEQQSLGFFIHPSFVVDAESLIPYGYADIKIWNSPLDGLDKKEHTYADLPIEDKESNKWITVSKNTQQALSATVEGIIIVQDREGDIYEQFATIPDEKTDLLIRARADRVLADGSKLFGCLSEQEAQGLYTFTVEACSKTKRKKRTATIELRYKEVEIKRPHNVKTTLAASIKLYVIEAREVGYTGEDKVCWRLLTTIPIANVAMAQLCIEWYSCRWMIEEMFKILKKEGFDIEASELEYCASVRKLSLLIMEVVIKLFLMRLAYAEPETELSADSCFTQEEQLFLEHQIVRLEGKTEKQKNPYPAKDLKRYTWAIARLGGWKGYESKRHPGITTLWIGLKYLHAAMQGWKMAQLVSTR